MRQLKHMIKRVTDEWEYTALVVAGMAFLITVISLVFGSGRESAARPPARRLPVPETMIDSRTAYAMLRDDHPLPELARHPFRFDSEPDTVPDDHGAEQPPNREEPRRQPRRREPPPPARDDGQAAPQPVREDEATPRPTSTQEPRPPTEFVLTYEGYRVDETGQRLAILQNHQTGDIMEIGVGRRLRGYMVMDFTGTELRLVAPDGREHVVRTDDQIRVRLNR